MGEAACGIRPGPKACVTRFVFRCMRGDQKDLVAPAPEGIEDALSLRQEARRVIKNINPIFCN